MEEKSILKSLGLPISGVLLKLVQNGAKVADEHIALAEEDIKKGDLNPAHWKYGALEALKNAVELKTKTDYLLKISAEVERLSEAQ